MMQHTDAKHRGPAPLTGDELSRLRRLVETHGEKGLSDQIGLTTLAIARALAGLKSRNGTVSLIRSYLQRVDRAA